MKYFILNFILLFSFASASYSQNSTITAQELTNFSNSKRGGFLNTRSVTNYRGTPYFNEWAKGHVTLNNKAVTQPIMLRYDMQQNAVQFSRNKNIYSIPANKLNSFVINTTDRDITFRNGFKSNNKDINPQTLLRIIYDGDTKLVAHHSSELKENLATYGTASKLSEFVTDIDFYLITKDGNFHEIKLKEGDILNVLKDQNNSLKRYANDKNLEFDEEADLKKLLAHYDSM